MSWCQVLRAPGPHGDASAGRAPGLVTVNIWEVRKEEHCPGTPATLLQLGLRG